MKMDKSLIIKELIKYYGEGKNIEFAKKLGIKPQTINTWVARNTFDIELIFAKCERINANWLLSGKGEMLRSESDERPDGSGSATEIELLRAAIRDKETIIESQNKNIELLEEKVEFLEERLAHCEDMASGAVAG